MGPGRGNARGVPYSEFLVRHSVCSRHAGLCRIQPWSSRRSAARADTHARIVLSEALLCDGPEDWGRDGVNSSSVKTRFNFDARVTERDLADTYLPAFEAGARPDLGAASGVMCSYRPCLRAIVCIAT